MNTGELSRPGQLSGEAPSVMPSTSARKAILPVATAARHGTVMLIKPSADKAIQVANEKCTATPIMTRLIARLAAMDPASRYRSS